MGASIGASGEDRSSNAACASTDALCPTLKAVLFLYNSYLQVVVNHQIVIPYSSQCQFCVKVQWQHVESGQILTTTTFGSSVFSLPAW